MSQQGAVSGINENTRKLLRMLQHLYEWRFLRNHHLPGDAKGKPHLIVLPKTVDADRLAINRQMRWPPVSTVPALSPLLRIATLPLFSAVVGFLGGHPPLQFSLCGPLFRARHLASPSHLAPRLVGYAVLCLWLAPSSLAAAAFALAPLAWS